MKRKICIICVLVMTVAMLMQSLVLAGDIMPLNNNTSLTKTRFTISDKGEAIVSVNYEGYANITTGAVITVKIEKRNFLLFWGDVYEEIISVTGDRYFESLCYQLEDTGTYRCTVEYIISGSGGGDDIINYESKQEYS